MYCKNCNLVYDDKLKFCTSCGEKLVDLDLLALLPEGERAVDNVPDMLFWRLQDFCSELNHRAISGFEFMQDEFDALEKFFDGDADAYQNDMKRITSRENVNLKNNAVTSRIMELIKYIKDNLWIFEASDYLLKKAGKQGIDNNRFRLDNVNLRDLDNIENGYDKLSSIDDLNFALNDFMCDLAIYSVDVADKVNELIE